MCIARAPASVWWTRPVKSASPARSRVQIAISSASSTRLVRMLVSARHPRMRRAWASMTNATQNIPAQVAT
jgi:hypothetical protein